MADPEVVASVKEYLNRLSQNGLSVVFGVLFGSHATGYNSDVSDIDLVVVSSFPLNQLILKNIELSLNSRF